jgi:glycosyltransferase involved in cell wall biosynthesis
LEPSKGHATAVDAIAALRRRGVECTLTIAGRGPMRGELERSISEQDLTSRVDIVEPVAAVEDLYGAHDVLLFPSRWEGLGNAVIEAMASGLPVVATDLDVLTEVLGPLGRFAPVDDAEQLARQLELVGALSPGERTALAHGLRERAISHFDPTETTGRLVDVYEDVARAGAR